MKITRRLVLRCSGAAAAALALMGASAQGSLLDWLQKLFGQEEAASSSSAASSAPAASSQAPAASSSAPALPPYDADPLTGEAKRGRGRIVAVMVNNICNSARQNARPQRGLSAASVLIESKVEGSISRLCALYSDVDAIPEVGPLRSGRDQFLQLVMPWQALYYHDGESVFCTQYVSQWDYSGLNIGGKSYFNPPTPPQVAHRDPRGGVVAYEHTEFTSGPEIRQAAGNAGIGLTYDYDATFFPFADYRTGETVLLEGCQGARDVTVRHSAGYQSAFHYSDPDKVYRMEMYSSRTGRFEPAVDELNSQQLAFENLLVCFAPIAAYPGDSGDVQQVQYIAGGEAFLFTRGRVRPCQWSKLAPDLPLEATDNGQPVAFNRGRTYLAIVDEDERDAFAFNA
mgnify:FL=1